MAELLTTFMAASAEDAPGVYKDIFLHVECATVLLQQTPDAIVAFINKALPIAPGWSSTRIAVNIKSLCDATFVVVN